MVIASADAAAYSTSPTENRAKQKFLWIQGGSSQRIPYIYWAIPNLIGFTVTNAWVELYQERVGTSADRTITAQLIAEQWGESTLTFNKQPTVAGPTSSTTVTGAGTVGRKITIDVTTQLQAVAAGTPWYGLRFTTDATNGIYVRSRQSSKQQPVLVIEYVMTPPAPTNLRPSSGRAVSIPRPTLMFQVAPGVTHYQLQINDVDDFTTPAVDTGEQVYTVGLYPTTVDMAVDDDRYFRVRAKNGAGWSAWSDTAYYTRKTKPVPSIVLPAAAPNNQVGDTTPAFAHTLVGVQKAYQYFVTDADGAVLWDSLRQGGAIMSRTPATPLPLTLGQIYDLHVRTEDDELREATPGDPVWAEAVRSFTFALDAGQAPVTALVGEQSDERPWWRLQWSRSIAPDKFEILRDGVTVAVVDAADALISGTSYEWVDREVPPLVDHVWEVRAITDGSTSATNPTDTGMVKTTGVWLGSVDGAHIVKITTEGTPDPVRWEPDEDVEEFRPAGSTVVHLVTHGIRGRQGDLQGFVKPYQGQTVAAARSAVQAMRPPESRYGTEMILTRGDETVRVTWAGVMTDRLHTHVTKFELQARLFEVPRAVA